MALHERHDLLDQKTGIAGSLHAQHHRLKRTVWHVFAQPVFAGIIDAYNDHGCNHLFADQAVGCFIDLPFDSVERGRRLKQILAVIEV